jgi:Fic/DOC family
VTGDLPPVPRIDPTLLSDHRREHVRLDASLEQASPVVARLLTRFALRITVAGVANVRPSVRGGTGPALFPPPRRFLSVFDRARLQGAAAAYRHVDSSLAMIQLGFEAPPALRPETPYVLNALTEGRMDNPDETNPGMIRGVEFGGNLPVAPYPPPPRDRCRSLLDTAMHVANSVEEPATVRAAWMLFVLGEIHPFADGNGRVARLLYLMLTGDDMPRTVDWGVIEQLRHHEDDWFTTLKQRDVGPSATLAIELSLSGARLTSERLRVLTGLVPEVGRLLELAPPGPELVTAIWLGRATRLDEVAIDLAMDYEQVLDAVEGLVAAGLVERTPTEPPTVPARPSYELAARARAAMDGAVADLRAGSTGE